MSFNSSTFHVSVANPAAKGATSMESKQPPVSNSVGYIGLVDGTARCKEAGSISASIGATLSYFRDDHEGGAGMPIVAESFLLKEPDVLDASLKKEPSIIDSAESIPGVKEFERPDGQGEEGVGIVPVMQGPPVLSEDFLLPMPIHMYSRRKKVKHAGPMKDSVRRNEIVGSLNEQESCVLASIPHEVAKVQDLHHTKKMEDIPSFSEQVSHPHASFCSVPIEKSKQDFSRGRSTGAPSKNKEGFKQQKIAKAKHALSPDKKRGRDTEGDHVSGKYGAIVDEFLRTSDVSEQAGVADVIANGKHAAVKAGLGARAATSIEKAWFKDALKQADGLRQYLNCRNFLLGLWEKDARHSFSITDCGLSPEASTNETSQIRLLRDIHYFLNYHGFINLGGTLKRPSLSPDTEAEANHLNANKAKLAEGLATVDKFSADMHSEMEAITVVSSERGTITSEGRFLPLCRKAVSGNQVTSVHEQKKKLKLGMVVHELNYEKITGTAPKPAVRGLQSTYAEPSICGPSVSICGPSVSKDKAADKVLEVARLPDEEFLLDIKNRIKARNRRKKQGLHEMSRPVEFKCQDEEEVTMTEREKDMTKAEETQNPTVPYRDILQCASGRGTQASQPASKKVRDVKVSLSQAGVELRAVKVSLSQADADLKTSPPVFGKDVVQGFSELQTQVSGSLSVEMAAQVTAKVDHASEFRNFGQALESNMPTLEFNPQMTDVTAKAQDTAGHASVKQPELPKIMSFQKFAKREHVDTSKRRPLRRETLLLYGKDLVTSGADARHSKVRDWSIDFSDSCSYLGSPRLLAMLDNASSRDGFSAVIPSVPDISSTEIAGERHESGLTSNQDEAALPSSKEATDDASADSSMRGSERRQSGVCLVSLNSGNTPLNAAPLKGDCNKPVELLSDEHHVLDTQKLEPSISNHPSADADKRDSQSPSTEKRPDSAEGHCCSLNEANAASAGSSVRLAAGRQLETQNTVEGSPGHLLPDGGKSHLSTLALSKSFILEEQNCTLDTSEQVKKAVTEYVALLLTPLYKTKRISKESFKSIMKKAIAKVMERRTEEEVVMQPVEFMDTKRKVKIRSLIDKLVERYLESVDKH